MYIQSQPEQPVQLPRDYSGSTFSPRQEEELPQEISPETGGEKQAFEQEAPPDAAQSVEAGAFSKRIPSREEHRAPKPPNPPPPQGGIFGRFPLLSALLPPPRGKGGKQREGLLDGDLREWLLIGVALLLLLRDQGDDILPLLLLLLLWD